MMDLVTWFDIIVIALVLILGVKGIINGLIKEAFGLIGLIGGLVVASRFSDVAESFISKNIYKFENPSFLQFVAFIGLWLVFWLVLGCFALKLLKHLSRLYFCYPLFLYRHGQKFLLV